MCGRTAVPALSVVMLGAPRVSAQESLPSFDSLLAQPVRLKPELVGVHPRVFVTAAELSTLRTRARTTHRQEWQRALATLVSLARGPELRQQAEHRSRGRLSALCHRVGLRPALRLVHAAHKRCEAADMRIARNSQGGRSGKEKIDEDARAYDADALVLLQLEQV
jgi:hypothetical protein